MNMWADQNPPRVPEVDWRDARDRMYSSWDERKEMAKAMNIAQEAYCTMKDTTGNKGRQFAEMVAAYLDGVSLTRGKFVGLNDRLKTLRARLNSSDFSQGRTFDNSAVSALEKLQEIGNKASHPGSLSNADKPDIISAMYALARCVQPDTVFSMSGHASSSLSSNFDDTLVKMFREFKITEETQSALSAEGYAFMNELEEATVEELKDIGIRPLIAKRIVEKGIPWAQRELPKIEAAAAAAAAAAAVEVAAASVANAKDSEGHTPLYNAAKAGDLAEVRRWLAVQGMDINAADNDGWTPLHRASFNGHESVVLLLLDKGADVNAADNDGRTPLYWASFNGHESVVRLLRSKGAR